MKANMGVGSAHRLFFFFVTLQCIWRNNIYSGRGYRSLPSASTALLLLGSLLVCSPLQDAGTLFFHMTWQVLSCCNVCVVIIDGVLYDVISILVILVIIISVLMINSITWPCRWRHQGRRQHCRQGTRTPPCGHHHHRLSSRSVGRCE